MLEACACHLPPHLPRRRLGLPAKLDLPGPSCLVGFYQISFISPIPLVLLSLLYLLYLSLPKLAGTFILMRAILARTTCECGDQMPVHMSVHIPVHICPRRRSGISDLPDRRCLPGSDGPVFPGPSCCGACRAVPCLREGDWYESCGGPHGPPCS